MANVAQADVTITTFNTGNIRSDGTPNHIGTLASGNYFVGNCGLYCTGTRGEYRNYFEFQIPTLYETITSASLELQNDAVQADQYAPFTYKLTSTPSINFSGLGQGVYYGFSYFDNASNVGTSNLSLSAAAISDISAGGEFIVSGSVPNITTGATQPSECAFGFTGGPDNQPALILTGVSLTPPRPTGVPEPTTWALMLIGVASLGGALRRRRNLVVA